MADAMKPGQTKTLDPNAADTESLTTFYETLYEARPDSEMAARFLVQYGLLDEDEASRLCKKYGIAKKGGKAAASSGGSKPKSKKGGDDDDFVKKPAKKVSLM